MLEPQPYACADTARVHTLLDGSVENLLATWHPEFGRFPFSSRRAGSTLVHNYAHPVSPRYTINSLLGLAAAARNGKLGVGEAQVQTMFARFLATTTDPVLMAADHGLLTVLEAELGASRSALGERVRVIAGLLAQPQTLNMQDLAWLLWGSGAAYRAGIAGGADTARDALALILAELVDPGTGLPRHSQARYRRNVVSFGSLVYFLRAMKEAADTLGSERARALFERGVAQAVSFQGPQGEWPWMIDCHSGRPFDRYPVFAVHQDAMAMLFLHPALDDGLPGIEAAISRSLAWDFGENELGAVMFIADPFFAYRSIERTERAPRARRFLRSLPGRAGFSQAPGYAAAVRINDECRSYHLGWILFAWSSRPEAHGDRAVRGGARVGCDSGRAGRERIELSA
jgi:hypothetical protein